MNDHGNGRVQVFDASGQCLAQWDGSDTAAGKLANPGGLAVDAAGNVYLIDITRGLVAKIRLVPALTTKATPTA